MIILLCEFDLSHVKTTNPAYLVVSGEKRELQFSLKLDYPMYAWFLEFFMRFSIGQTSFICLETWSDMVTCVWYPTSNILQCIHALFKKEHPGRGSLIPSRGKDPCSHHRCSDTITGIGHMHRVKIQSRSPGSSFWFYL